MLTNEDIYTGVVNPSTNINPKIVGAFYINTKTAKLFVCKDNTINKNVWEMCNPDVVIPEIPVPKFKFSVYKSYAGNDMGIGNPIAPYVWYANTTDELWFYSLTVGGTYGSMNGVVLINKIGNTGGNIVNAGISIRGSGDSCSFVIPKGYQFMVAAGSVNPTYLVKLWL